MIYIIVIFAIVIVAWVICFFTGFVAKEHKRFFPERLERNDETFKDLTVNDFEFLKKQDVEFADYKGAFYYKEKSDKVIFLLHGYGAGHQAYLTEINNFCSNGYAVFSFDYSGCQLSGGRTGTFYTAVKDAEKAYDYLTKRYDFKHLYLFGHSWGGYVALILASKIKCDKVVALCPLDSANAFFSKINNAKKLNKILPVFRKTYLWFNFGSDANISSYKIAEKINIPTLVIFGEKDAFITARPFKNPNIKTIVYKNKAHNPYNTEQAEKYLNDCVIELNKAEDKKEFLKTVDYKKITEEDDSVMNDIFKFLK